MNNIDKLISEHITPDIWGDIIPLPDGLPDVAKFHANMLPEAFRGWVIDIAERMQCPPDFSAVAAIVTASAVIGRQVGIYPKRKDDWLVMPNLWGAIVGRPSLMKTPALTESRKILSRLEVASREKYDVQMEAHTIELEVAKIVAGAKKTAASAKAKEAIKDGMNPVDAVCSTIGCDETANEPPKRRRYVTQDPTVEKLGELLNETPRGLLVFRDELIGLLRSIDKDGHENDRGFYLEAWNGNGAYTYDRIARGTLEIDAACISLLGGIQPGPLRAYISQANSGGAGDDGLLQRMQLLVWPDRWPDTDAKNRVYEIFQRHDSLTPTIGPDVSGLRFDEAAQPLMRRRLNVLLFPASALTDLSISF